MRRKRLRASGIQIITNDPTSKTKLASNNLLVSTPIDSTTESQNLMKYFRHRTLLGSAPFIGRGYKVQTVLVRGARLCVAITAYVFAVSTEAQTTFTQTATANETGCNYGSYPVIVGVDGCVPSGTRTQTTLSQTVSPYPPDPQYTAIVTGQYAVNYSGAIPTQFGATISGTVSYTGSYLNQPFDAGYLSRPSLDWANYQQYSDVRFSLDSINLLSSIQQVTLGNVQATGTYGVSSPTSIINGDSVALSGSYHGSTNGGAIVLGTITGTATVGVNTTTPYKGPLTLTTTTTYTETTRLDETGLTTPKIAVTQGIDMNGSKVTNLAAGTAAGDAVNKAQLDDEASARAAADTQLATAVITEAAARANADGALATAIQSEAADRATVDNTLAANLSSETSARIAADANLSSRLDGLSSRVDALNGRIDRVQRRADAGTAVAVAMGGAVFLPDTHFNLTANVATYGGARAGAVQVGAMLGRHVAFNAGVATGFNRGGQTAGRAGVTLGW